MCWRESRGLPRCEEPVMLLELPDIRQTGADDCGEAARNTVLMFLGESTGRGEPMATAADGTHPATLEAFLRNAGLIVQSGTMTAADLQHHTRQRRPVLCPIASHGGHWVVVRGVERGKVFYQCPADGPLSKPVAEWLDLWRDMTRAGHHFDRWGIAVASA